MPAYAKRRVKDRTGQKFNNLTAISFDHQGRNGVAYWLFECSCGKQKVINATDVAKNSIKSCGCKRATYYREAFVLPDGAAGRNQLYLVYRHNSRTRKLSWDLSIDDFTLLTKQDCFYCGVEPRQVRQVKPSSTPYLYNGLDRVDNAIGYTRDNVVPCCLVCNMAKHAMTQQMFLEWIERICKFRFGEQYAKV